MTDMALPPGQRTIGTFPRFGTHLHQPPPELPTAPSLDITGAVTHPVSLPLEALQEIPQFSMTADFHCVSGWSATNLGWQGVAFTDLFERWIAPLVTPGAPVTHILFGGLDGFESVLTFEDAMGDDVMLATHLEGHPLEADHGAPIRLVSPQQYGYMSTKHLCTIEIHTSPPRRQLGAATAFARLALRGPLVMRHPRARVWAEERHPHLPSWLLRPLYRLAIRPGVAWGARTTTKPGSS
jgi:DMSO/TMAO reductase YedYZ molybdopterin-dependent catalytic subunit